MGVIYSIWRQNSDNGIEIHDIHQTVIAVWVVPVWLDTSLVFLSKKKKKKKNEWIIMKNAYLFFEVKFVPPAIYV